MIDPTVLNIISPAFEPEYQSIILNSAIDDVRYIFTSGCSETITASAKGLPPGVTMSFNNNIAEISGTVTGQDSITYIYSISAQSQSVSSTTVTGSIHVQPCRIDVSLISGPESQTVSQTNAMKKVIYQFNSDCSETLTASVTALPPGVTMSFNNNLSLIHI